MNKRNMFQLNGLEALEGRLAPALIIPAVSPPADVDLQGDFQDLSGDQTTPDTTVDAPDAPGALEAPETPEAPEAASGRDGID